MRKTTPEDVSSTIETALASGGIDASSSEIAFFGGSFTAIDKDYMISLLEATKPYIKSFRGIRISTRPDRVSEDILMLLKKYGVTSIELGAQSMSDEVLKLNNRGHSSDDVRISSNLIKKQGFSLGLQMMTGLYGSTDELDMYTASEFIALSPDTVRIYPTVILRGTALERYLNEGKYNPHTVDSAVRLCSEIIPKFEESGISVIRVGLHSSDTMENSIVAGAYHPAFRELCESRIYLNKIINELNRIGAKHKNLVVYVPHRDISKATGQKKYNISVLSGMGYSVRIIPDPKLTNRQIRIQEG